MLSSLCRSLDAAAGHHPLASEGWPHAANRLAQRVVAHGRGCNCSRLFFHFVCFSGAASPGQ